MNHHRSRRSGHLALVMTCCAGLAASVVFADPQPQPSGQPPAKDEARDKLRERVTTAIETARTDQKNLETALQKIDGGASFDDVRGLLPDRFWSRGSSGFELGHDDGSRRRGRMGADDDDRPPPGERGERSERGGPGRNDQPFSPDDWEAVHAIIIHAQPEMLKKFQELRQQDPAEAQRLTLNAYPRLRPLLDSYKHDRPTFNLRLEEMAIIRESLPLAKKVLELREQGKTDDSAEMKAAREELRGFASRLAEARRAIQLADIEAMRKRLDRREKELAEQAASPERAVERSIDGLIKHAERGDGSREREDGRPRSPKPAE